MEKTFKQSLISIDPKNKRCVDCGENKVTYVSINNGVTICNLCAQIHRQFGEHISEVKKIDDEFDEFSQNFLIYGGNKNFKKALKKLGVDLNAKRSRLYKTAGVDYYRKWLLSKVKGEEFTEKSPENPNEEIQIEDNKKGDKKKEKKDNMIKEDKEPNNFLNINNNLGYKTNICEEEDKVEQEEDKGLSNIQLNEINNINNVDNLNNIRLVNNNNAFNDINHTKKGILRSSLNKIKNIGGYIRKNSTKSIEAFKKAGNIIAQKSKPAADKIKSTAKYVGEHMPYFHKYKVKSQEDIRNDYNFDFNKNNEEEGKENGNQLEF